MSQNPPARRTLADIIMEKITEKQTEIQSQMTGKARLRGYNTNIKPGNKLGGD